MRTIQKVGDAYVMILLGLTCLHLKFLADAREERRRAVMRMLSLVDDLSVKHINITRVTVLLDSANQRLMQNPHHEALETVSHPRQVRRVAEACCETIQGNLIRLWAALMHVRVSIFGFAWHSLSLQGWKSVQNELTFPTCSRKLWQASM